MHQPVLDFLSKMLSDPARVDRGRIQTVVEIGARSINGTARVLFADRPDLRYIGIDVQEGPDVDVVADGVTYDPGFPVDLVLSVETFEHAPDVDGIVRNVHRMLAPGGYALFTAATNPRPQHSGVTGNFGPLEPGEVYRNVDCAHLQSLLVALFAASYVEVDRGVGDVRAWARKAVS